MLPMTLALDIVLQICHVASPIAFAYSSSWFRRDSYQCCRVLRGVFVMVADKFSNRCIRSRLFGMHCTPTSSHINHAVECNRIQRISIQYNWVSSALPNSPLGNCNPLLEGRPLLRSGNPCLLSWISSFITDGYLEDRTSP